ncbi:MAG: GatB/YqeY domain-containing protein [Pseudomonadota bacterium]
MTLQEKIKNDLTGAIKAKDEEKKSTIRVILGEFSRGGKKELPDDEVISILKKLVKSEREVLQQKGNAAAASPFIDIIETYLPRTASEAEIAAWVRENVDFSQFKNKMQAMKPVMAHFGSRADGNMVKKILQEI